MRTLIAEAVFLFNAIFILEKNYNLVPNVFQKDVFDLSHNHRRKSAL